MTDHPSPHQPHPEAALTAHWMRPILTAAWPKRHLFMDSEAWRVDLGNGVEEQSYRLSCAQSRTWSRRTRSWTVSAVQRFGTPYELWVWASDQCIVRDRTVMWCHNLGYDFLVTQVLDILPDIPPGWRFEFIRLGDEVSWAKLVRKDGAQLYLVDSMSWVPKSLESLGLMLPDPLSKPPLPDDGDSDEAWYARCEADVVLLRAVVEHIQAACEDKIAPWRPTGTAAGWGALRLSHLHPQEVLVHDDMHVRELERIAAYAGRGEVLRWGTYNGHFTELDFSAAYAHICAGYPLPTVLKRRRTDIRTIDDLRVAGSADSTFLVSATVQVPDDEWFPLLPSRNNGTILWPTGTLRSTWWAPELLGALPASTVLDISEVWEYELSSALAGWGRWCIDMIDGPDPLLAQMVKHWSRCTVGRFGMRVTDYVPAHQVPGSRWIGAGDWIWEGNGDSPATTRRMMQIHDQVYIESEGVEGAESAPQVMSYVMMITRLRLWDAVTRIGVDHVVYMDTDGLIADRQGLANAERAGIEGLRPKAVYGEVTSIGPKQLVLDGRPRIAGLPRRPKDRHEDGSWEVEIWERTRRALEQSITDRVHVRHRRMHPVGTDGRRMHLPGGVTAPIHVDQ